MALSPQAAASAAASATCAVNSTSRSIAIRPHPTAISTMKEQTSTWESLDGSSQAIDANASSLADDEHRSTLEGDLQAAAQGETGSPAVAGLVALPHELQLMVAEYVTMDEDKKSLCLTCKSLQQLMTPFLYKNMVIGMAQLTQAFGNTLTNAHPGVSHIRTLRILSNSINPLGPRREAVLLRVVTAIPHHALTEFHLPTTTDVTYNLDLFIRFRQQNVTNRQYHSPAWRNQPSIAPQGNELAQVTTLQLYLQQPDDCERASVLIERAPGIRNLAIEFKNSFVSPHVTHHLQPGRPNRIHNPIPVAQLEKAAIQSLFQAVNTTTPRVGLESLRIKSAKLKDFLDILPTKLPLQTLRHLHLTRCRQAGSFVQMLSQLGVDLESYVFPFYTEYGDVKQPNEAILQLMTSPKRLIMRGSQSSSDTQDRQICDWATLAARASSLRSLRIYDDIEAEAGSLSFLPGGMFEFYEFCIAASGLEQLAISSPLIESERWDDAAGLMSFLGCVSRMHALKVLYLVTYPACWQDNDATMELSMDLRELTLQRVLQEAADRILQTLCPACPELFAVILQVNGDHRRRDRVTGKPYSPPAFIRSKKVDSSGAITYMGLPVKGNTIKHHVPCFDLLDD